MFKNLLYEQVRINNFCCKLKNSDEELYDDLKKVINAIKPKNRTILMKNRDCLNDYISVAQDQRSWGNIINHQVHMIKLYLPWARKRHVEIAK
jgi:hypothetical protein